VDFNRAGVPLMELVTEPDIHNAEEAVAFAKELQLILRYLGISDADMEKAQMRVEANVSLSNPFENNSSSFEENSRSILGTKVELKNINSFKAVHDAIEYELERQEKILEEGDEVVQETRGWNAEKGTTESQRTKESAHDYRYFPEPDLPPLDLKEFDLKSLKLSLPELPHDKRIRFAKEFGLTAEQIEVLLIDRKAADFFEEAVSELQSEDVTRCCNLIFNYLTSDLFGLMKAQEVSFKALKINPENFADLVALVERGELNSRMAKDILAVMFETGEDPRTVIASRGMRQVSDKEMISKIVEEVISDNHKAILDYKKGKENAIQFLVGQVMSKLEGQGNPLVIREIFIKRIDKLD
jgi:aspartyl-tRNA(Asn)/glutamyl-tRNA(Gln) amidotransferase subunit B